MRFFCRETVAMAKKRRRSENSEESKEDEEESARDRKRQRRSLDWSFPLCLSHKTEACHKLYDFLRKYKDETNRVLCEGLIRAPSRRVAPRYYEVVSQPIDLMKLQQRLKTDEYRTVQAFLSDMKLLFDNAHRFYEPSSQDYQDASVLEDVFLERVKELARHMREGSSEVKSPPPLTLKIPKSQLISPKLPASQGTSRGGQTGAKVSVRMKLTRSKAWVEEYASSEDPMRILLATVYDYHDAAGEFVAEPFHELPSAKDYPEYYQVITEPLDLNIVKKNVDDGKYNNLREIQDDLLLIIKNAHYFNEPNSEIYKMASVLRKFVLTKCSELERKFQTVAKTQPLKVSLKRPSVSSSSDPKRTYSTGSEESSGRLKTPNTRSKSQSSETDASGSDSESSDEELSGPDGEGEEAGGEGVRRKSLPPIKKEKLAGEDPVCRLLKQKKPPPLKKQLLALFHSLVAKTDASGRVISELFMKRPSAKVYPEYYLVIKEPIDLREIKKKIRNMEYSSLEDMVASVDLMVSNACTFNEEESQVYADAVVLKQVIHESLKKLKEAWLGGTQRPTGKGSKSQEASATPLPLGQEGAAIQVSGSSQSPVQSAKVLSAVKSLLDAAVSCVTPQGVYPWIYFKHLPNPKTEPQYYAAVKKPIDTQTIQKKAVSHKYSGVHQTFEDLHLLCDNVFNYYPKESQQYRNALVLYKITEMKYMELTAEEHKVDVIPNVQEKVKSMLQEIVSKTVSFKDGSGRRLSDSLKGLTLPREASSHISDSDPVVRSVSLSLIEQRVMQGQYPRLDLLQSDLFALFSYGRLNSSDPQVHGDLVCLQQHYIAVRDKVCCCGELLWSPALGYTSEDLNQEISKGRESTPGTSSSAEPTPEPEQTKDDESVNCSENRQQDILEQVECDGQVYRIGDIAYVRPLELEKQDHIVLLEKLWRDGAGCTWLEGCWFYRPEETFHLATRKFYENEVFKSDFHGIARTSRLKGKCYVLFIKDYVRSMPEGYGSDDVYVCESRYSFKGKSFKKIKNWNFLSEPLPNMVARESPLLLKRVPSVFATEGKHEEAGEIVEGQPGDTSAGQHDISMESVTNMTCEYLQNVVTESVYNPDPGCTYYEQYCIDEDRFRLGDFVYVRSDQERPFIARIERMWTDSNKDPWFRGPWFVRPNEIEHVPSQMFFKKELFMSNITDSNPMRSIIGKCAVMSPSDFCKKRPTEIVERDVFVVEFYYHESTKETKKFKLRSKYQLSKVIIPDEMYIFPEEIQLTRVPLVTAKATSLPPFVTHQSKPLATPPPPPPPQKDSASHSVPVTSSTSTATPPQPPLLPHLLNSTSTQSGGAVVNISPQVLQTLLSSAAQQLSTTKPVIIPLQQPSISSAVSSSPAVTPTAVVPKVLSSGSPFCCRWEGCGQEFTSYTDLASHVLFIGTGSHISKEVGGNFYCRWYPCPRNPMLGGRPFDTITKITRHLKEVHLLKLSHSAVGLSRRSQLVTNRASPLSISSASNPPTPIPTPSFPVAVPPSMPSFVPPPPDPVVVTTASESSTCSTTKTSMAASIFHPPPKDRRQLVHSDIYLRYIRGLQSNTPNMAAQPKEKPRPPKPIVASDWLSKEAISESGGNVEEALWALREHMIRDAVRLSHSLDNTEL